MFSHPSEALNLSVDIRDTYASLIPEITVSERPRSF